MDSPHPYRKERALSSSIPRDRRAFHGAILGSVIGALVGTSVTLAFVVRVQSAPPGVLVAPIVEPCRLDPASAVVVTRDPLPDLPRYPGALVRTSIGDVPHNTASVILETCASFADVRAFYRGIAKNGLVLDGERSGDSEHHLTFTKDDPSNTDYTLVYDVTISRANEVTRVLMSSSLPRLNEAKEPNLPKELGPSTLKHVRHPPSERF